MNKIKLTWFVAGVIIGYMLTDTVRFERIVEKDTDVRKPHVEFVDKHKKASGQ